MDNGTLRPDRASPEKSHTKGEEDPSKKLAQRTRNVVARGELGNHRLTVCHCSTLRFI